MKYFILSLSLLFASTSLAGVTVVTASGDYQITASSGEMIVVKKAADEYTTVSLPASPSVGDEYTIKDGLCAGDEYGYIAGLEVASPANSYAHQVEKADRYILVLACSAVTVVFDGAEWLMKSNKLF